MLGPDWHELIPEPALESSIAFLNDLSWEVTWGKEMSMWKVWGGEVLLFSSPTGKEAEAFIVGMALALRALPDDIILEIKEWAST